MQKKRKGLANVRSSNRERRVSRRYRSARSSECRVSVLVEEPQTSQALHGQDESALVRARSLRRGRKLRERGVARMRRLLIRRASTHRGVDLDHSTPEQLCVHPSPALREIVV